MENRYKRVMDKKYYDNIKEAAVKGFFLMQQPLWGFLFNTGISGMLLRGGAACRGD
jgi:hypothetical protein